MRRSTVLAALLAGALVLYLLARTKRGQQVASDVLAEVIVTARRIAGGSLPRGIRNNNPGNLRALPASSAWRGQIAADEKGFGVYESMELGVRAAGQQLLKYARSGLHTVRQIVSRWAPPNENDTTAYVRAVAHALNVDPDAHIDVEILLADLAEAIFKHENGGLWTLTRDQIARWVRLP